MSEDRDQIFFKMVVELLNIRGAMVPHVVVSIVGDGACLFRAISFALYETQSLAREVRNEIVAHVVHHWAEFCILSHDSRGNNYNSPSAYFRDMSQAQTYGGLCELVAAGQMYRRIFEVYYNRDLYARFGYDGNPISRLRFTAAGDLSHGHFDVYLLHGARYPNERY